MGNLKNYRKFLLWLHSKVETVEMPAESDLYLRGDRSNDLFFIVKGDLGFVFDILGEPYFELDKGNIIGLEDLIYRMRAEDRNMLCDKQISFAGFQINVEP